MVDIALFDKPIINTPFELALQELDILFNTCNTELIGRPDFGINFLQFLWELTPNNDQLESYIRNKITVHTVYLKNMKYDLNVIFLNGKAESVYVIKIKLYDSNNKTVEKTFTIK